MVRLGATRRNPVPVSPPGWGPSTPEARFIDRLIRARRWDEAIRRLAAFPPDAARERVRRMALANAGRLEEAARTAERVAALDPGSAADWTHLAHIRVRLLRTAGAFVAAERARRLDPQAVRPPAILLTAAILDPALLSRLDGVVPPAPVAEKTDPPSSRPTLATPWRTPFYRAYGGDHPIVTSALGTGSAFEVRRTPADAPRDPGRVRPLLPELVAWAKRTDPAARGALADFLVHRLPLAFHRSPDADLVLMHTIAAPLGRRWALHLESLNMLLAPMVATPLAVIRPDDPNVVATRDLLRDPRCVGVFTHIRETRDLLGRLMGPEVAAKTVHIRHGLDPERPAAPAVHRRTGTMLFTNSLVGDNFNLRGGTDVLAAFLDLHRRRGDIRLIIRSGPPVDDHVLIRRAARHPAVTWLTGRLSDSDLDALHAEADFLPLPSTVLHAVSLVRALRHGVVPVVSDVFGVGEFVRHGINGLIVPGRRASITPRVDGAVYAEDCRAALFPSAVPFDPAFRRRFRAALSLLLDNPALTARLRARGRTEARRERRGDRWAAEVSAFLRDRLARGG